MANHRNYTTWDEFVQEITGQENSSNSDHSVSKRPQPASKPQTNWDLSVPEDDSLSVFLEKLQASAPFSEDEVQEKQEIDKSVLKNTIFVVPPPEDKSLNLDEPEEKSLNLDKPNKTESDSDSNDEESKSDLTANWTSPNAKNVDLEMRVTTPQLVKVQRNSKSKLQQVLAEIDAEQKRAGSVKNSSYISGDDFSFHPPQLSTAPSQTDMPKVAASEANVEVSRITLTGQAIPRPGSQSAHQTPILSSPAARALRKTSNHQPPPLPNLARVPQASNSPSIVKGHQPPPLPTEKERQSMLNARKPNTQQRSPMADQVQLRLPAIDISKLDQATMALNAPDFQSINSQETMALDAPNFDNINDAQAEIPNKSPNDNPADLNNTLDVQNQAQAQTDSQRHRQDELDPNLNSLITIEKKVSRPKIRTSEDAGDWVPLLPRLGKRKKPESTPQQTPSQENELQSLLSEARDDIPKTADPDELRTTNAEALSEQVCVQNEDSNKAPEQPFFKVENQEDLSLNELISDAVDPITQMTEPDPEMMTMLAQLVENDEDTTSVIERQAGTITEKAQTQTETAFSQGNSAPKSDPSTISIDSRFPLRPQTLSGTNLKAQIDERNAAELLKHLPFSIPKGYSEFMPMGSSPDISTFRAVNAQGQKVALKCFDMRSFSSHEDEKRLRQEISALKEIECKGIPQYIDFIEEGRYAFLVETFIDAPSLAQRIESGFKPTLGQVLAIMHNAAWILKALETRATPILHRNICPANILVDDELNVSIVDFESAVAFRPNTIGISFAKSGSYIAPEQIYGKATPASDIFGLGMSIIHLVTGCHPCEMEMSGLKPNIDKYIPQFISSSLRALLHDMIEPDPTQRIADANELLDNLANLNHLKIRKKAKRFSRFLESKRHNFLEIAHEKLAPKQEKHVHKFTASKAKSEPIVNLPERAILHDNIDRRTDVYRSARVLCIFQLATLLFIVFGLYITDNVMTFIFQSWNSLFLPDLPIITLFSMIVSCFGLILYCHYTNRGLIPLNDDSTYLQKTRNENKLLNDLYRYALTCEQSATVNYCLSDILTQLYWDKSSDELESLRNSENQLRELTQQAIASSMPDNNMDKPVVELNIPNDELKNALKLLLNENEDPQFKEDDFCIACPPPKELSVSKLLFNTLPCIILTFLFIFLIVPLALNSMEIDSPISTIIYVFINLIAMILPYVLYIGYIVSRGQTSSEYRQKFKHFRQRFLLSCQKERLEIEETERASTEHPIQ